MADGLPEACAAIFSDNRCLCLSKEFKDIFQRRFSNTDAGIHHATLEPLVVAGMLGANFDLALPGTLKALDLMAGHNLILKGTER
ncbi:MAG: hypothetical protein ACJAYE_003005 [Candidatus Azotimanducaceae bacterium]|jgi:hypothetical protein